MDLIAIWCPPFIGLTVAILVYRLLEATETKEG
jgi:hypothetical protein